MDITRELFNVVFLLYSIINFIFYVPLIWLFNLLRVCFRFVYLEELAGKVILITEASSGIGKHLAIEYAKEGACLALVATREKQLQTVARDAKAMGSPDVIAIPADVSKHQDCSRLIEQTIQHFGKLDYLVNNAAIATYGFFEDQTFVPNDNPVMDINFWGSVYTTHFALPHLKRNQGKIIVICSCGGWCGTPGLSVYNASKTALVSFFETLKMELDSEVDITIVTPGLVDSNLTEEKWMEEANVKWAPTVSVERCVKAIVNSTKCGDKYVVEPPWMMTVLLWKILCPEIFNWVMNFLFVTWPNISSKKARSHKSR
ncbi:11-beta-hydroxysteroid dehydrogenase-like 2 [Cynara cardunculus var. scolymus]|uniref:11-beta-hydroxysteroid dehydrogenase-like 2 n=1 Tax=Cynara cardunculus var. scolymus TaxID=59895 RepID=UPI000D625B87|nr:11-beta-hydroxysteroid dehydrogenase-like 2 [Cynara cardunculus var. scolymus]